MKWRYFNEGGLNLLFVEATGKKLLRVPKVTNGNSTTDIYRNMSHFDRFREYFPKVEICKLDLSEVEDHQLIKSDNSALLMDNLLHGTTTKITVSHHISFHHDDSKHKVIVEFKPKWLYGLRTKNCRNCCLNHLKRRAPFECRLGLLEEEHMKNWCHSVFKNHQEFGWARDLVYRCLSRDGIIDKLFDAQMESDFHSKLSSLESESDVELELQIRMTLRDVTLFVTVNKYTDDLSVKMIDIDLKPASKFQHWKNVEKQLSPIYDLDLGLNCFHRD